MIVNHVSADSPAFKDFLAKGDTSEFADMFLTFGKVFPNGATEQDLLAIYRPRPGFPFNKTSFADGSKRLIWTTFTPKQIDIDVFSRHGAAYLDAILARFREGGYHGDPARCRRLCRQEAGHELVHDLLRSSDLLSLEHNRLQPIQWISAC